MPVRKSSGLHHPVAQYAKSVTQGKLKPMCCKYEILSCQRHLDDLKRQGTKDFPWVFDETRADRVIDFFRLCNHVRGALAGKPIALEPWQVFDIGCIYGWVHKDTGQRRYIITYNKRARGNAKSTEVSVKCLYHMTSDAIYPPYQPELAEFEYGPEVECAAVDRGQAKRVFDDAVAIAKVSPAIAKRMILKRTRVEHKTRGGFMRALSKDLNNKDSGAPCYFEVDEYHAHRTSEIYDIGKSSFGKRAQSLLDVITTAGKDAENSPCKQEEDYAKKILDSGGALNERYFVMIRELDDDDNPHDKGCWLKANPMFRYNSPYAKTLYDQVELEYTAAYGSGDPSKIREFLIKRMCRWQSGSENKYMDGIMERFKQCSVSREAFANLTDGQPCNIGYDLGKRVDLSGVGAVFTLADGRIAVKAHAFMPENGAQRHEKSDRVPYLYWAEQGYCTLTPGDVTDNSFIQSWIAHNAQAQGWRIDEIDYDGHNATDLAILLGTAYGENKVVEIAQTCKGLNQATKRFRELVLEGKLIYEENPLFEWCVSNAIEVHNNFGDIKLSKRHKDDSQRIDPLAAVINALARVLVVVDTSDAINKKILDKDWSL